jgi:protein TonB
MQLRTTIDLLTPLARAPLARMLALSLSLHLALIVIVQPRVGARPMSIQVINVRLVESPKPVSVGAPVADQPIADDLTPALLAPASTPAPPEAKLKPSPANESTPTANVETVLSPTAQAHSQVGDAARQPARDTASTLPSIPVMIDTNWYSARQLDVQPRARDPIQPDYPEEARKAGTEGVVTLIVRVDELGQVRDVRVENADPPGVFDDSAARAFKASQFFPARLAGAPVRAEIRIRVTYKLND